MDDGAALEEGSADVFEGVTLEDRETLDSTVGTEDALAAPGMHWE